MPGNKRKMYIFLIFVSYYSRYPFIKNMFKIVEAKFIADSTKLFKITAPDLAKKQHPGQFVLLRLDDHGERIPLTIAGADLNEGTITLVAQGIGYTTKRLNLLEKGDSILNIAGPLGECTPMKKHGTIVVIGGGVGTAIAYPVAKALKEFGNTLITINGARNKDCLIFQKELEGFADECFVTTDDGSLGHKGFVTEILQKLIDDKIKIDYVFTVGPIPMMSAVANLTKPYKIKTVASLNPIMIDGTGMCGACRVTVDDEVKFACIDGPEFDAHLVDFKNLSDRNNMYKPLELESMKKLEQNCKCNQTEVKL